MGDAAKSPGGILVRRIQFEYPDDFVAHWNPARPEWSQLVNASSLLMPYLEPYLINAIRAATQRIADPGLLAEARAYMGQEAHHYKQHRRLNDLLIARGYDGIRAYEQLLADDYARLERERPLEFHLAYAAGFETMALAMGHMLVRMRRHFFQDADPSVSSLVLWHFVEELEHKHAAFDVYQHVVGRWGLRLKGLVFATVHTLSRTRRAYVMLLRTDGLWGTWRTRLRLKLLLLRIVGYMIRLDPRSAAALAPPAAIRRPGLGARLDADLRPRGRQPHPPRHATHRADAVGDVRMTDALGPMPDRVRARLFRQGLCLFVAALAVGWLWFFSLLGRVVLWPIPGSLDVRIPDDPRGWRMAHMEFITNGLLLMGLAVGGRFMLHTERAYRVLYWSAVITAWLFAVAAALHPLFGTRGLEFGGGPFKPGVANDVLYVVGWPPVVAVHVLFAVAIVGVTRYLRQQQ